MNKGDLINGYLILDDFTTAGGGLCKWTFARRGDREVFIKEFLSPTYPVDGAPGSATVRQQKRRKCELFEQHHRSLMEAVASKCGEGGNLIFTRDFFRFGTKYYKITEKIDVLSLTVADISSLPLDNRVIIMLTVAHSLGVLHKLNIVHGDLKPNNILIKKTALDGYVAKLIDFDNSFFAGRPPAVSEEVVGDLVFYSPELARYVQKDEHTNSTDLGLKSDVFALGLVYSLYLFGDLPAFDQTRYQYPCIAANNDATLEVGDGPIPDGLRLLVNRMLRLSPRERPSIYEVYNELKRLRSPSADTIRSSVTPEATTTSTTSPRLKGRLLTSASIGSIPAEMTKTPEPSGVVETKALAPKLRGKLLRRD